MGRVTLAHFISVFYSLFLLCFFILRPGDFCVPWPGRAVLAALFHSHCIDEILVCVGGAYLIPMMTNFLS